MKSFIALCVLLLLGHLLRSKVKLLRWMYLPSCVIAGLAGLLILQLPNIVGCLQQTWVLGWLAEWAQADLRVYVTTPADWTLGWSMLPGVLINVVFACLFLGVRIPRLRKIWFRAAPQLAFGQVIAWGQYVIGVGLTMAVLVPVFGVPEMFGAIVPVGFEGGHGTAGGMKAVFTANGWAEGGDFALASATMGMCSAIVVGMVLINWATRRGMTAKKTSPEIVPEDDSIGVIPVDRRPSAGRLTVNADVIESFSLHLVFVGVAVGIGYLLKGGMVLFEGAVNADLIQQVQAGVAGAEDVYKNNGLRTIVKSFPTFPLCMIGGLIVQIWEQKFDKRKLMDLGLTRRIQNTSLDFLVVPAIAMIKVDALIPALAPFAVVVLAAILWNVFCVTVLARRMLPDAWFERSITEMGQSMGVTSTGLLLLRVVDPDYKTPAANAFAYKQILHEPFMGGGLWTSAAVPLIVIWGGWPVFGIACGAVAFWLILTFCTPIIRTAKA
jgi:ESS family glutamate:Na+ symporter